jgi:hypothetical protein
MATARRLIDLGKMKKLRIKRDRASEYNVLLKGFPRRDKLNRIKRYSRLIIMNMKG